MKEPKIKLYKMLRKYDTIISKSDNCEGQTDLIKRHTTMKPDAAPIAAQSYPLALKHHDFLKKKLKLT